MKQLLPLLICSVLFSFPVKAYDESFEAPKAGDYTIDGIANESFWANAQWYTIDNVWLPYGATMADGDFSGRIKFAWTSDVLLVLAVIEDDILSDDHENPTDSYWEDDCLEIFLDEDHSGGEHTYNYNAFAYHVSTLYDVVDLGTTGAQLYNDHVDVKIVKNGNTYTWEMAIKIFDDSYDESGSNTPVVLTANKEMGLSVAYCDNDETTGRENFIGIVNVSDEDQNAAYQNADVFGTLTLVDESSSSSPISRANDEIQIYPTRVDSYLNVEINSNIDNQLQFSLYDLNGRLIKEQVLDPISIQTVSVEGLASGAYLVKIHNNNSVYSKMVYKQ